MKLAVDSPQCRASRGFTLVELLIVISILVILAALVVRGVIFISAKSAQEKARTQLGLLEMAIEKYHQDHGSYPNYPGASGRGSSQLYRHLYTIAINPQNGGRAYLTELDPAGDSQGWLDLGGDRPTIVDPWGSEYYYRMGKGAINTGFDLWSAGPDGRTDPQGYPYAGGDSSSIPDENRDDLRLW